MDVRSMILRPREAQGSRVTRSGGVEASSDVEPPEVWSFLESGKVNTGSNPGGFTSGSIEAR